jgi:hypothetical protein
LRIRELDGFAGALFCHISTLTLRLIRCI